MIENGVLVHCLLVLSAAANLAMALALKDLQKGDLEQLHAKVRHPTISSKSRDLKPETSQMNSRCNVKVMSLESPMKTEVQEAYDGGDEHEDSPSIKRELSDFDLQVHEAVASKGGYDLTGKEMNSPNLNKNDDPGIGKCDFWDFPKLKRSCSNLERRGIIRKTAHHFPSSRSQSFENLQELSANQMINLESPRSVMTQRSADKVMLKRRSSSQVLPSGNILEPKKGKTLRHVRSPSPASSSGEYFSKNGKDKNIDNPRRSRFHKENKLGFLDTKSMGSLLNRTLLLEQSG
ncbi:hypothetical protein KIW84_024523 [Lathyrus oleraceus]|uniref:Uncharacterized protein n=1 Tax=Pisum sativum TaxID=3888 RepID=A0A9D4YLS6_PEA|nr:hypothetical protein KIW84_024522 [Pisum sativum]KAI5438827.1 hypothetical protein KIW84_024523 [Pisum sativum]